MVITKTGTYHCPTCGSQDVQGTAWVHLNSDEMVNDEPPTNTYWCPDCDQEGRDGHFEKHICMSDGEGRCQTCKAPIRSKENIRD